MRHALRQLGMHTADDAAWLSAVAPALVWARILRNVEQGFKRQGSIREAWFFRSLAGGLHPEEVKMQRPYVHYMSPSGTQPPRGAAANTLLALQHAPASARSSAGRPPASASLGQPRPASASHGQANTS